MSRSPDPSLSVAAMRDLAAWREEALRAVLLVTFWVGTGAVLVFLPRLVQGQAWALLLFSVLAQVFLGVLAFGRLSYGFRATSIVTVTFGAALALYVQMGPAAAPAVEGVTFVLLTALFFGTRAAAIGLALLLSCVTAIALGYVSGSLGLPVRFVQGGPDDLTNWTSVVISTAALTTSLIVAVHVLVRGLRGALAERGEVVDSLRQEVREREQAHAALIEAHEQLARAQKMELAGLLAGGIAHDVNNALTVILGEAELLELRHGVPADGLRDAALHAAQLTRQLLGFGRHDVVQARVVDLGELTRAMVKPLRRLLPSEIELRTDLDHQACVRADPAQIQQVLFNLAINARDAMMGGGTLTLGLRHRLLEHPLGQLGAGEHVELTVEDTGVGMDSGIRARAFEPFFTTKPMGQGTGLGLPTARQIVEDLGGALVLDSEPEGGTRARVVLPTTHDPPDEPATRPRAGHRSGGETVLVVDDDIRVRAVMVTSLREAGYQVLEAGDGRAAISVIEGRDRPVDLLLTDVVMPRMGAAPLLEWFTGRFPETPVLVCSGFAPDENLRRGVALGAYPFLAKPFGTEELRRAVRLAIDHRASP